MKENSHFIQFLPPDASYDSFSEHEVSHNEEMGTNPGYNVLPAQVHPNLDHLAVRNVLSQSGSLGGQHIGLPVPNRKHHSLRRTRSNPYVHTPKKIVRRSFDVDLRFP